ncbi:Hypothetical predicted protein [Paramuricea clavata]|uniref:Uncharacterized protein n=1 Tax=Paramuricea clavata TaxID=317549 RepID=A0A7D9DYL5_PARCT|nr:Hypothetical predicted protein [Paramuricea clavata]
MEASGDTEENRVRERSAIRSRDGFGGLSQSNVNETEDQQREKEHNETKRTIWMQMITQKRFWMILVMRQRVQVEQVIKTQQEILKLPLHGVYAQIVAQCLKK